MRAVYFFPPVNPTRRGSSHFANGRRIVSILEESAWTGVDVQLFDVACAIPESELVRYLTRLGPVGVALQDADDATRAQVIETVHWARDRSPRRQERTSGLQPSSRLR